MRKLYAVLLFSSVLAVVLLAVRIAAGGPVNSWKTLDRENARLSESSQLLDTTPAPTPKPQPVSSHPMPERAYLVIRPPHLPGGMHVGMDILVGGRQVSTIQYEGRTYLPIPEVGAEYQIRVWNHGPRRIAAIVSVDGLSVITGEPASESQPGYIVAAYSSVLIKGWRRRPGPGGGLPLRVSGQELCRPDGPARERRRHWPGGFRGDGADSTPLAGGERQGGPREGIESARQYRHGVWSDS